MCRLENIVKYKYVVSAHQSNAVASIPSMLSFMWDRSKVTGGGFHVSNTGEIVALMRNAVYEWPSGCGKLFDMCPVFKWSSKVLKNIASIHTNLESLMWRGTQVGPKK